MQQLCADHCQRQKLDLLEWFLMRVCCSFVISAKLLDVMGTDGSGSTLATLWCRGGGWLRRDRRGEADEEGRSGFFSSLQSKPFSTFSATPGRY